MKVLHIASSFPLADGPPVNPWLVALVSAQREAGLDAQVLAPAVHGVGDGMVEGIPVWRFRYAPARIENLAGEVAIYERLRQAPWRYLQIPALLVSGYFRAGRLQSSFDPDIVHAHWPVPMGLLSLPFQRAGVVFHYHQTELSLMQKHPGLRRLFRPVIRRAKLHLCNSSFTLERLRAMLGDVPAEVVPMPFAWPVPERLPPKEPDRVLFVGRMVHWKGGDILLRSCGLLLEQGRRLKLVMIGDGPERGTWEALARSLNLDVEFKGWLSRDALMNEYARAMLLALPSRYDFKVWVESLGVVLLEALACGTAVIAGRVGGPLDIVRDGQNGFFFEPMNDRDLAEKMDRILSDPGLAERLGGQGREDVRAFSPQAVAAQLAVLYGQVLAQT